MAEFPLGLLRHVKVEPVDDECPSNGHLSDDEVNCLDDNFQQPLPPKRRAHLGAELEQLKAELRHTHQIISEQCDQLEKADKKISELKENIHHQDELLMRTEADQSTNKAVADAEIGTLRKLLEEERKGRIFAEQRFKKLLDTRRNSLLVPNKSPTCRLYTRGSFRPRFSNKYEASSFRPTASVGGVQQGYSKDSDDDDVVILNVIENPRKPGACTGKMSQTTQKSPKMQMNIKKPENHAVYRCIICGATFNADWKLANHVQWHKLKDNSEKNLGRKPLLKTTFRGRQGQNLIHNATTQGLSRNVTQEASSSSISKAQSRPANINEIQDNKFACTLCEQRYPIVSKLKIHMKQAHDIMDDEFSIGCRDCGKVFSTRKQHVRHRRLFHGTRNGGQSKQQSEPQPKSASSFGSPPVKHPSNAGQSTTSPVACSSKSVTINPPLNSQGNQEAIAEKTRSKLGHTAEQRKYICDVCGRIFTGLLFLKLHKLNFHNSRHKADAAGTSAPFSSSNPNLEGATVDGNDEQREQSQLHALVGPDPLANCAKYPCTCGRQYLRRGSFMIHLRTKNNGKIFKCSLCSRSFDLHSNLKIHVRQTHKVTYSMGRYACGSCAQTFESSSLLVRHRFYLCKNRNKKDNNNDQN